MPARHWLQGPRLLSPAPNNVEGWCGTPVIECRLSRTWPNPQIPHPYHQCQNTSQNISEIRGFEKLLTLAWALSPACVDMMKIWWVSSFTCFLSSEYFLPMCWHLPIRKAMLNLRAWLSVIESQKPIVDYGVSNLKFTGYLVEHLAIFDWALFVVQVTGRKSMRLFCS